MIFLEGGTPNLLIQVKECQEDCWTLSRSIDMSRESVFYPNGTGPWGMGVFSSAEVQKMAEEKKWRLHDGRYVKNFEDFTKIPEILKKERIEKWSKLTGSTTSEENFRGVPAVALVADAFSVFDVAAWGPGNCLECIYRTLKKTIRLDYDRSNRGIAESWAEAVEKYGLRIEPLTFEALKSLRRQAEDHLRKDMRALPHRLSALLRGNECYPFTISSLRLPQS